jgi:predicted nucleotidyltransferase
MIRGKPLPKDINARLATLGDVLAGRSDIAFAYLFGAAATRQQKPLSDVDLGVYFVEGLDPGEQRLVLLPIITGHLQTDDVDLVVLNDAPIALRGRLLEERHVIVDRDPFLRHRFESQTIREYLDFRQFEHRLLSARYGRG